MNETKAAQSALTSGTYDIDPGQSELTFSTRHLFGLGSVRGSFRLRSGQIYVGDVLTDSRATATISAASFESGSSIRDSAVLSSRFLNVEAFPIIRFDSKQLSRAGDAWVLHGQLAVRDVTASIEVNVEEAGGDENGLLISAYAHIDRYQFGIKAARGLAARDLALHLRVVAARVA